MKSAPCQSNRLWILFGFLVVFSNLSYYSNYNSYNGHQAESTGREKTSLNDTNEGQSIDDNNLIQDGEERTNNNESLVENLSNFNNQTDNAKSASGNSQKTPLMIETAPEQQQQHCPSLYKVGTFRNEHSPVIYARDKLLVCRTPKVASTMLRSIAWSYLWNTTVLQTTTVKPFRKGPTLDRIANETLVLQYLYGSDWRRVLFVRHPVPRILSGFLQIARFDEDAFWKTQYSFSESHGAGPDAFELWLRNSTFQQEYDPKCGDESTTLSLDSFRQHWVPPQQCRCGLWDCGVNWTIYRVEEHLPNKVMADYIPSMSWLASESEVVINAAKYYNTSDYLTKGVLELLNAITKKEQEFFGYQPYTTTNS